jgi:hypothetical protein
MRDVHVCLLLVNMPILSFMAYIRIILGVYYYDVQVHYMDHSVPVSSCSLSFSGALVPKFHRFMNSGNSQIESCFYVF